MTLVYAICFFSVATILGGFLSHWLMVREFPDLKAQESMKKWIHKFRYFSKSKIYDSLGIAWLALHVIGFSYSTRNNVIDPNWTQPVLVFLLIVQFLILLFLAQLKPKVFLISFPTYIGIFCGLIFFVFFLKTITSTFVLASIFLLNGLYILILQKFWMFLAHISEK